MSDEAFRCGFIAVVGRPNVGKSTLVNALVGAKVSIVSAKPQTTRHRIHGIRTEHDAQYIFVDTPGFQTRHRNALNQAMNRTVQAVLVEVDVILFVLEAGRFGAADEQVLRLLPADKPVLLVANKVDLIKDKDSLLPWIKDLSERRAFAEIVPMSALKARDVERLLVVLKTYLPPSPPLYDSDQFTDRDERFLAAEILREKIFRLTGDEVPYGVNVAIERFSVEESGLKRIEATIWVDRASHRPILLGERGQRMKRIATEARMEMERLFGAKVFLQCWVKVKHGWAENEALLKSLGFDARG
ncbi:MAG: GTPase Era [Thiobacillaceae bacterium]|nr:GTPase Era [Thiobacillaceae bacterium]MCX7673561.1 GTPase Era [Thiobacillaceae bacterium]MDW8323410.1 GTPase Era [Burkholderiales bacterium]